MDRLLLLNYVDRLLFNRFTNLKAFLHRRLKALISVSRIIENNSSINQYTQRNHYESRISEIMEILLLIEAVIQMVTTVMNIIN